MSKVLATDLDGTFIPLENQPENATDLTVLASDLRQHDVTLTFVTGRHLASVQAAIEQFSLPMPDWVICDVGTSVYLRNANHFEISTEYVDHLQSIVEPYSTDVVRDTLTSWIELRAQEDEKQGRFKLSFYCQSQSVESLVDKLREHLAEKSMPYSVIGSVDPFNGDGLIDLLPHGVSKAHALRWWAKNTNRSLDRTVFAGDSGNDLAAMTSGFKTIVVGNADRQLAQRVEHHFVQQNQPERLFLAEKHATSGVLEGCRYFGLI